MPGAAILQDRAIISLEGADVREFLQGLITNDIANCRDGAPLYAALLTPQGKILFDFLIAAHGPNLLLDCAAHSAADLLRRLNFYRLRAKVTIAARPDLAVAAIWNAPPPIEADDILVFPDPRLPALGTRLIGQRETLEQLLKEIPRGDYDVFRLQLGVPDSADLPSDQVFALDAGLQELNGVSFSKGCYVGQEVTARMKHRATARRRFYIAEADPVPATGATIEAQAREVGKITSAKGNIGLALVRLDRLADAEASGTPVEADSRPIRMRRPEWLRV